MKFPPFLFSMSKLLNNEISRLNHEIVRYNENREDPIGVFVEIMSIDLSERQDLRPKMEDIIDKIVHHEPLKIIPKD